ncbi:MAG: transporter [Dehalococcoidia bacterium]|nr:MAG: transporter [Dehalococcoidia bacterium]
MIAFISTLVIGLVLGYLGQRSRFCAVGGFRDFFLIRDARLLKGYAAIIITGFSSLVFFKLIGGSVNHFPLGMDITDIPSAVTIAIAAMGMGYFSTLADGCPFRQHVAAATGRSSAMFYLVGFYIGIGYYLLVTAKVLNVILALFH